MAQPLACSPHQTSLSTMFKPLLTGFLNYSNPFETQGTKNIGERWSAGGGSDVHTPGAATPRGNKEDTTENQVNPKGSTPPKSSPQTDTTVLTQDQCLRYPQRTLPGAPDLPASRRARPIRQGLEQVSLRHRERQIDYFASLSFLPIHFART